MFNIGNCGLTGNHTSALTHISTYIRHLRLYGITLNGLAGCTDSHRSDGRTHWWRRVYLSFLLTAKTKAEMASYSSTCCASKWRVTVSTRSALVALGSTRRSYALLYLFSAPTSPM